jgi:hypothetical protein
VALQSTEAYFSLNQLAVFWRSFWPSKPPCFRAIGICTQFRPHPAEASSEVIRGVDKVAQIQFARGMAALELGPALRIAVIELHWLLT